MMSEEERRSDDNYLAYLGQELGILDTAKAEGREEGREEKALEIARKILKRGTLSEVIAEDTALSLATIQELAKELGLQSSPL